MKNFKLIPIFLISAFHLFTSCEAVKNTNNAQRGAVLGTALGGVLGAVIANNTGGKSEVGAVIGGIVGGVSGGLIGNKMDKQAKEIKEVLPGADVVKVNNGEGLQVILEEGNNDGIKFETNAATLNAKAKANVEKLAQIFKQNADTNLTIIGHTDDVGKDDYNLQLSSRRANAVVDYLVANGVSRSRLTSKGMGETQPKAPNTTDENRSKNRRVEIFITPNEKLIQEAKSQAGQ